MSDNYDEDEDGLGEQWSRNRDAEGNLRRGLNGELLHPFDGWYCITWPVRGEWVVSDQAGWLPGSYPTEEAAVEAARVANTSAESVGPAGGQ